MLETDARPIGVFDSGLGGLTVVRALSKMLPKEHIVYYGDTARVPYGSKSRESIIQFSEENTDILLKYRVKMVVVACNSSSSYALPLLRKKYSVPVLGVIVPGAQKAVEQSRSKRIGVIATTATITSGQYTRWIKHFDASAKVYSQNCPLFVPLVEEGWLKHEATRIIAEQYFKSLVRHKVDTVILGCTHYPLLKKTIQKIFGSSVHLVDSADAIAQRVKATLNDQSQLRQRGKGQLTFLVSDKPQEFERLAKSFLGHDIGRVRKVKQKN